MRTMKPKAKLKKNNPRFGRIKLPNAETTGSESPDLSKLRKPIDINLSSLKQVAQLLEKGSDEVQAILTYECDVVYECRICRSLFRSLANFISHKRVYCLEKHSVTLCRRTMDPTESIYDKDTLARSEISIDPDYKENCTNDRILRSQAVRKEPKKDLTSVVDMLTKKQNDDSDCEISSEGRRNNAPLHITSDSEQVLLEIIDSKRAAYQTVLRPENPTAGSTDLMKTQAIELKNILNRNTAVLGPDGQLLEVDDIARGDGQWADEEEFEMSANSVPNRDLTCTICNAKFSTKKTLTFHVKTKHMPHRMCYSCPYCTSTFTNRWSVYRHLFKVHRQSNEQVRRLRSQIQAKAFRRDLLRLEKVNRESETSKSGKVDEDRINEETQNLIIAQEWMENLELDAELQRCGSCGKRFERKAALMSHLQICPKRFGRHEGTIRNKRTRKNPPQRVSESVDTETSVAYGNDDDEDHTILEESEERNIEKNAWKISAKTVSPKSMLSPVIRKSDAPSVVPKTNLPSVVPKTNLPSVVPKTNLPTVISDEPMEISIRVEGVSSLSKDVWDKIGTSDDGADRDSPFPDSDCASVSSPPRPPSFSSMETVKATTASAPATGDVPEVIYTSIDNSRPVALSVLETEKKLGIQYRGIRLPTVTLEKINVQRCRVSAASLEPNVSVNLSDDCAIPIDKVREPSPFRKLQCLPCNRKFTTVANLRRHVAVHTRRYRYRCKMCDFKSLLKCHIVAHCNKRHNTKNNRVLLADLVVEMLTKNDLHQIEKSMMNSVTETRDELEIIDMSSSSTKNQKVPVNTAESEATSSKVSTSVNTALPSEQPKVPSVISIPVLRPRRGRPPNSKRIGRRAKTKKKQKIVPSVTKIVRHVSPPRLPDDSSDEMNDIGKSIDDNFDARSSELSRMRAPSRLDRDPELRKMVMEVIFGSSQKETDADSKEDEPNNSPLDDINIECDEMLELHEDFKSSPPKDTQPVIGQSKVFGTSEERKNVKIEPGIIANRANNNVFYQRYPDYNLKTIAINRDAIVFPKKSNCLAIEVSTADPVDMQNQVSSSLSPNIDCLMIHEDDVANNDLTVPRQTEIILRTEK